MKSAVLAVVFFVLASLAVGFFALRQSSTPDDNDSAVRPGSSEVSSPGEVESSSTAEPDASTVGTSEPDTPPVEYGANCVVLFKGGTVTFADVVNHLKEEYPWLGAKQLSSTEATVNVGPEYKCRYKLEWMAGPDVPAKVKTLGAGTEHAAGIKQCDSMILVSIEDLDVALDEINYLMELEVGTSDAVNGYVYLPWSENIIASDGAVAAAKAAKADGPEKAAALMNRAFEIGGYFAAHGMWSVHDGETLNPILAYNTGTDKKMERLVQGDAVSFGQKRLASNEMKAKFGTLVCDARIPVGDEKLDALIIEIRDYDTPDSEVLVAIPYERKAEDDFRIYRPKILSWENCDKFDVNVAMEAFFKGVDDHKKGSEIWKRCLDESK